MKIRKRGDKTQAICHECRKIVTATFDKHDVPFEGSNLIAEKIMAATCDECGAVIVISAQAAPAILAAKKPRT